METPTQNRWNVSLLGTLRAIRPDGARIERFPTRQTAALFAYLVYQSVTAAVPQTVSREMLAEMLWPGAPPDATRKRLAQALSALRRLLERDGESAGDTSVFLADRQTIGVRPGTFASDVEEFLARLGEAQRTSRSADQTAGYEKAVALYGGELLPGFYDDWALRERERLTNLYGGALHQLIARCEASGENDRALRYAHTALAAEPYDEAAHEAVVRLLTAGGQTTAALRHYGDWERRLKTEEDRSPRASLRKLAETLRRAESPAPVSNEPAVIAARTVAAASPAPLTRFFGRESETAYLLSLLYSPGTRLVTLTGTGGTGKTRLALEVLHRFHEARGGDNDLFVPLANLASSAHIPAAITEALFRGAPAPPAWEFVLERLSRRAFVLVLDNLEHLQNDGPEAVLFVRELLQKAPRLTLLVTSRQRLAIGGEREFPLPPLPAPSAGEIADEIAMSPSVRLFVDRAQAVRPDFALTADTAPVVGALCARLEGIPLALELCAAWARVLTPHQMLEKLENRFDLLVSRRVDIEPRHRTLRAALEYGYLLLPPDTRKLFAGLALFQGGWTLDAAEAVCDLSGVSLLGALTELRERSMILAEANVSPGVLRFRMLETLREFAGEQFSFTDAAAWRRRHAAYFLRLAEESESALSGPDQGRTLNTLEAEQDNFRAALHWSLTEDPVIGLRLAGALTPFWDTRGHLREGREWLQRLLEIRSSDRNLVLSTPLISGKAWSALGRLAWSQGDFADASLAQETALVLWRRTGSESGQAQALYSLGATVYRQGDLPRARTLVNESLVLAERCGDSATVTRALNQLGNIAQDDRESIAFYERSLAVAKERGDRQHMSTALHNLGTVAGLGGEHEAADRYFHAALAIRRDLRDDYGVMTTLMNLGKNALLQERLDEAGSQLAEAARLAFETGRKHVLSYCLKDLGLLALAQNRDRTGVRTLAAALRLSEEIRAPMADRQRDEYEAALTEAKKRLGAPRYAALWSSGQAAPLDEILADATETESAASPPAPADPTLPPSLCSACGSARRVRHGRAPNGKQKFRCAACGKGTRENPGLNGYATATKTEILAAYRAGGISLRGLTARFGVSRNTVLVWLRESSGEPKTITPDWDSDTPRTAA